MLKSKCRGSVEAAPYESAHNSMIECQKNDTSSKQVSMASISQITAGSSNASLVEIKYKGFTAKRDAPYTLQHKLLEICRELIQNDSVYRRWKK